MLDKKSIKHDVRLMLLIGERQKNKDIGHQDPLLHREGKDGTRTIEKLFHQL